MDRTFRLRPAQRGAHLPTGPRTARRPRSILAYALPLPLLAALAGPAARADALTPDEQAAQQLNAARRAFDDGKFQPAADGFKQYLQQFAGQKDAPAAAYGLGLAILQLPQRDYPAAVEALQKAAANPAAADRPFALYYLGVALRGQGNQSLAKAAATPAEADALRKAAQPKFEEAAKQFAAAQAAFQEKAKGVAVPDKGDLPTDAEWAIRARCDAAEMLLQTGKVKEAAALAEPFQNDPILSRSKYRPLGLYHLGYAKFSQKDYPAAGRAVSQLAPFQQPFGPHARYLLARVHHLSDERPEAIAQYKAVLDGFDTAKKQAKQDLQQNPANLDPDRKSALEALANGPPPEYVVRAFFYSAVLQYEAGQFAEAADKFTALLKEQPKSPLAAEAQLRLGFCRLQQKNNVEAIKTLQPLVDHPPFADRAQWWLAKAQLGAADPNNAAAYEQAAKTAVATFQKAADRAAKMADDPDAKGRRGDILLDMADAQLAGKLYKEAAATYAQLANENLAPDRAEEAMQRRVTALHLAGQYKESDDLAAQFEKTYARSTLLPAVLFRSAENAYLVALEADKKSKDNPAAKADADKQFGVALERYRRVVDKFPEFEYVDLARQAMGTAYHRRGEYDKAIDLLIKVPEPSRTGELATVPYLLADSMIRTMPPETPDALSANRMINAAEEAAKLLEGFVGAQPKGPQAPDALLKLGYCYGRIAVLLADKQEQQKTLAKAKEAYDKCQQQFPNDPATASAVFERARALAAAADPNLASAAMADLRKFQAGPLATTPNAPLAMVRLSALLRAQGKAAEAADVMKKCQADHEAALLKDPARADWVPMVQYEYALAVKENKKPADARTMFENVAKTYAGKPAGLNAAWRAIQCRREEVAELLDKARKVAAKPGVKAEEVTAAYAPLGEGVKALAAAAETLRTQADQLAVKGPGSDAHLWMLYELAWSHRLMADVETDAARQKMRQEAADKVKAKLAKELGTQAIPALAAPDVPASAVPPPAAEGRAREFYGRLIAAAPESPLANQARYELAEVLIARGEHDAALDLLQSALENGPPLDLTERVKLRLATCFLARDDAKDALAQAKGVMMNPKSDTLAEARYLVGESLVQQQEWQKAVDTLTPFRDQDPFRSAPDLADRALLRLAFAFGQLGNWDAARQCNEAVVQRFAAGQWADEARYGVGWCLQNQKRYDEAANAYAEVTKRTAAEVAAKAQYNVGVCRGEQKKTPEAVKALQAVAYVYDYPEWSAAAWYQAGVVQAAADKKDDAAEAWRRVVKDYPASKWAPMAQQKLAGPK